MCLITVSAEKYCATVKNGGSGKEEWVRRDEFSFKWFGDFEVVNLPQLLRMWRGKRDKESRAAY